MKSIKKGLAWLLTVAMILSLCIVPVFADTQDSIILSLSFKKKVSASAYATIDSAKSGDTIYVEVDYAGNPQGDAKTAKSLEVWVSYTSDVEAVTTNKNGYTAPSRVTLGSGDEALDVDAAGSYAGNAGAQPGVSKLTWSGAYGMYPYDLLDESWTPIGTANVESASLGMFTFKALSDITDFSSVFAFVEDSTWVHAANAAEITVVYAPALAVAAKSTYTLFTDATADDVKAVLESASYIDATGASTDVKSTVEVTLPSTVSAGANDVTFTYGGSSQVLSLNFVKKVASPTATGTYTYTGSSQAFTYNNTDNANYTVTGDTSGTNAGTYNATAALNDKTLTQWADGGTEDKTLTWTIGKADKENAVAEGGTKFGKEGSVDVSAKVVTGGTPGTPGVTDTNSILDGTPTIADGVLSFKFKGDAAVDNTATVEIPVTSTNYKDYKITVTLTVQDKFDQDTFKFEQTTKSVTYGDAAYTLAATGVKDGASVVYATEDANIAAVDAAGQVTIKAAGTVTISAIAEATADYKETTVSYTLTIAQKEVTISGLTAKDKKYDGTTAAAIEGTAVVDGALAGDAVSVTAGTAAFADANVGTGKTVTAEGYALAGEKAANYKLTAQPTLGTADITKADAPTLSLTAVQTLLSSNVVTGSKDYTNINLASLVSGIPTGAEPTFVQKTAGAYTVFDGTKFTVDTPQAAGTTDSVVITANFANYESADFTVSFKFFDKIDVSDKIAVNDDPIEYCGAPCTLAPALTDDTLDINGITVTYKDSLGNPVTDPTDVGVYTETITYEDGITDAATGVPGHIGTKVVTLTITAKPVTITGTTAADKEYDGTTAAAISAAGTINGLCGNDVVTITAGTAAFADKNVGEGKTVTFTGFALAGEDAGNYTLSAQPTAATAKITAKALTVNTAATGRAYVKDDLTVALTGDTLTGVITGDHVTASVPATGTMADDAAGTGKAVTATVTLAGNDAANYTLTAPAITVDIAKADRTVTASPAAITLNKDNNFTAIIAFAGMDEEAEAAFTTSVDNTSAASISGSTVTGLASGSAIVTAVIPETANYNAAADVTFNITVEVAEDKVTVNYNMEDGTISTVEYALTDTEEEMPKDTKSGYDFKGWSVDGTNTVKLEDILVAENVGQIVDLESLFEVTYSAPVVNEITVPTVEGGKITVDPESAAAGKAVTVTVTPDDGYKLEELTVTSAAGRKVLVNKNEDGTFTFNMPSDGAEITATFSSDETYAQFAAKTYSDILEDSWMATAVGYCTKNKLFQGYADGTFKPDEDMTRAMAMVVLARFDGQDTTVTEGKWYAAGLEWAVAKEISDGSNPDEAVTREQLVTMIWRYMGKPVVDCDLSAFTDADKIHSYASDAMKWAVSVGLIQGYKDGSLNPAGTATRAEFAKIMYNLSEITK